MTDLGGFRRLVGRDHGLCVVSTLRADDTIHSSVVNAGVLDHPMTGASVVGFVALGGSRKLVHLRARPASNHRGAGRLGVDGGRGPGGLGWPG